MPRPKSAIPSYRKHKASGQAYVRIDGRQIYLGKYNTPESKEKYRRILAEMPASSVKPLAIPKGQLITVAALVAKYAETPQTDSCPVRLKSAIRPLLELYASLPAEDFTPKKLKAVRTRLIEVGNRNDKHKSEDEVFRPLASSYVNQLIKVIIRIFRWAVTEELIPAEIWHGLQSVRNISRLEARRNEKLNLPKKVKPVALEHIDAVLPLVLPEVAAMIQLQLSCPLRPNEITIIRPMDIKTDQKLWEYVIRSRDSGGEGHKTDWHDGEDKVIYLGPKAQSILMPWLTACPNKTDFLFSPKRAVMRQYESRRKRPSKILNWKRKLKDRYTDASYRKAVERACDKANIPKWTPNQIRHTGGTIIREQMGVQAAQVALGHRHVETTQIYAEVSRKLQKKVACKLG